MKTGSPTVLNQDKIEKYLKFQRPFFRKASQNIQNFLPQNKYYSTQILGRIVEKVFSKNAIFERFFEYKPPLHTQNSNI